MRTLPILAAALLGGPAMAAPFRDAPGAAPLTAVALPASRAAAEEAAPAAPLAYARLIDLTARPIVSAPPRLTVVAGLLDLDPSPSIPRLLAGPAPEIVELPFAMRAARGGVAATAPVAALAAEMVAPPSR